VDIEIASCQLRRSLRGIYASSDMYVRAGEETWSLAKRLDVSRSHDQDHAEEDGSVVFDPLFATSHRVI